MYLAEYLPRLEQISVTVEIGEKHNAIKSLALRENALFLETGATEDGQQASATDAYRIHLPVQKTSALAGARISKLACGEARVSLTLTLENAASKVAPAPFTALSGSNGVWSVEDLLKKTPRDANDVSRFSFSCAQCNAVVVDSALHKFVDMPLEYWHEMMDFWHCHKPHEDHHNVNDKNYNGKLSPRQGFVHVGSSYILLPQRDENCVCGRKLGTLDGEALKINKWNLHLQYSEKTETYPPFSYVYFAILDRVNALGVRKFTVRTAGTSLAYNVWVTSVGLDVSYGDDKSLSECLKLLYAVQTDSKDDDVVEVPEEPPDR
ncbi:hypothetical protein METBIDRAFT_12054 [Metschnikowia bicuspidata var. bicuspidata NRRL YB-4993]|uniref:Ubiquitin-conjugating enzyme E2C-binding protein n=1 Tax=Metschnikowia bicuspidata var. bicuspidata NRRL YB-4993 TaxID=869754 RepID=A0A1A0HC22_9ASCO|nr:hypothetical protein METBIDRAFT_12054 [Metschnikowia bicuspidata var. bicuspidata NRRL YB-4993]OBA21561.1 hypothetical protein METBIDRAFT_12054 [Metschnikowia bicuspidata var. bicuspidata NRRL YB-4993]